MIVKKFKRYIDSIRIWKDISDMCTRYVSELSILYSKNNVIFRASLAIVGRPIGHKSCTIFAPLFDSVRLLGFTKDSSHRGLPLELAVCE